MTRINNCARRKFGRAFCIRMDFRWTVKAISIEVPIRGGGFEYQFDKGTGFKYSRGVFECVERTKEKKTVESGSGGLELALGQDWLGAKGRNYRFQFQEGMAILKLPSDKS